MYERHQGPITTLTRDAVCTLKVCFLPRILLLCAVPCSLQVWRVVPDDFWADIEAAGDEDWFCHVGAPPLSLECLHLGSSHWLLAACLVIRGIFVSICR